jgi:hypothetical protein
MTMSADQIKNDLKQLHEALSPVENADPQLKALLRDIDHDIHRLLAAGKEESQVDAGLIGRVEDAANEFAMKHPAVAGLRNRR